MANSLWQDVRYALRMLRRSPGFTLVAMLSLALGIGANTAIFSLINALMLRPLPVRDPGQLVEPLRKVPNDPSPRANSFSYPAWQYIRDHNHVFSRVITASDPFQSRVEVRAPGVEEETASGQFVDGNFFSELGIKPARGRFIGPNDDRRGAPESYVAVLGWSFWARRFHSDPAILGKTIFVSAHPVTVVGITPREFFGLQIGFTQDLWLPLALEPGLNSGSMTDDPGRHWLALVGRLRPGVTLQQAWADLSVLDRQALDEEAKTIDNPGLRTLTLQVAPAGAGLSRLRDQFSQPLLVLMCVVGLLLLICCTNVASMLLARGAARQREMALRVSLGAGRWRLMRQVMTESLLLSVAGSVFGMVLASVGARVLVNILSTTPREKFDLNLNPDAHMLLFATGAAVLTGLLFGMAPALHAFSTAPASALRASGKGSETRLRRLFGKALVSVQVALSVVLLTGAGLFVRHLVNLETKDLGFTSDHVLLMKLDPSHSGYDGPRRARLYQELLARLASIPGVRSATLAGPTPIAGMGAGRNVTVESHQDHSGDLRRVTLTWIVPRYFETLGTRLLAGRDFSARDVGGPRVLIVNEAMARHYFGTDPAVGRHVTFDGDKEPYEIIGVAANAKYSDLRDHTWSGVYFNAYQYPRFFVNDVLLRTSADPYSVTPQIRQAVRETLKSVNIAKFTTLSEQIDSTLVPERLIAALSEWFGTLGAVLASIGLYGLLAYTVARRINEIGIRMALGATRAAVVRMVLADALGMVVGGLAIGIPLTLWSHRVAASLIQGLPATSIAPVLLGAGAMTILAVVAAYVPARRAAAVDPMEALRYE